MIIDIWRLEEGVHNVIHVPVCTDFAFSRSSFPEAGYAVFDRSRNEVRVPKMSECRTQP